MFVYQRMWDEGGGKGQTNKALSHTQVCPHSTFPQAPPLLKGILLTTFSGRRHTTPNTELQHCGKEASYMTARKPG